MQGKNRSEQVPPCPGDGTQPAKKKTEDANWFGTSCEPQEEFIENDALPENSLHAKDESTGQTSDSNPSFHGGRKSP